MNCNDMNDSAEMRRSIDRLYHRLKRFGYHLQRGRTVNPDDRHIQLKRVPIQRGFKITDMVTGEIVGGENFTLTYEQAHQFWEQEATRQLQAKREKLRKQWRESKDRLYSG